MKRLHSISAIRAKLPAFVWIAFGLLLIDTFRSVADDKASPSAVPASMAGFTDEGTFAVYKDEDRLATMTFKWHTDGTFNNKIVLSFGGQTVNSSLKITPDAHGCWTKIQIDSPRGAMTIERKDDVARRTFKDKVETTKLKPGAV